MMHDKLLRGWRVETQHPFPSHTKVSKLACITSRNDRHMQMEKKNDQAKNRALNAHAAGRAENQDEDKHGPNMVRQSSIA